MSEGGLRTHFFLLNIQKEPEGTAAQKFHSVAALPHTTMAPLQTDCSAVISAPSSNVRKSTEIDPKCFLFGHLPGRRFLLVALTLNKVNAVILLSITLLYNFIRQPY